MKDPKIFSLGRQKGAKNLILVPYRNSKLIFMDYYYRDFGSAITAFYTTALLKLKTALPSFTLIPKSFHTKLVNLLSFEKSIDFQEEEGYSEFSKLYYLEGEQKKEILNFFNPERIKVFQQNPGWHVFAEGNYLVVYKEHRRLRVLPY